MQFSLSILLFLFAYSASGAEVMSTGLVCDHMRVSVDGSKIACLSRPSGFQGILTTQPQLSVFDVKSRKLLYSQSLPRIFYQAGVKLTAPFIAASGRSFFMVQNINSAGSTDVLYHFRVRDRVESISISGKKLLDLDTTPFGTRDAAVLYVSQDNRIRFLEIGTVLRNKSIDHPLNSFHSEVKGWILPGDQRFVLLDGRNKKSLHIFDIDRFGVEQSLQLEFSEEEEIHISKDKKSLVIVNSDKKSKVYVLSTAEFFPMLVESENLPLPLSYDSRSQTLYSLASSTLTAWNPKNGKLILKLRGVLDYQPLASGQKICKLLVHRTSRKIEVLNFDKSSSHREDKTRSISDRLLCALRLKSNLNSRHLK